MKIASLQWMVIATSILIGSAITALGADARKEEAAAAAKLITALETADYPAFVSDGEPAFKKLTKDQFASVSGLFGPRLKAGYTLSYLGDLKQKGYRVTLWKVIFSNGSDDALATLSMKGGRVGGFFIR